jgi:hypothetical protein
MSAYDILPGNDLSTEDISKWNGKEMEKISWNLHGVITQT